VKCEVVWRDVNGYVAHARSKINLALHVVGRTSNGYHQLSSLVAFCDIADELSVKFNESLGKDRYHIEGPFGQLLSQEPMESNLIVKAVCLLRQKTKETFSVDVTLSKNLPLASGIGGGSTDAAAMLNLLNRGLKKPCLPEELAELALTLGADVPMCLDAQPKWISGIGEVIAFCASFPEFPILLVNPLMPLSTPQVFKCYKESNAPFDVPLEPVNLRHPEEWVDWLKSARNALYSSAIQMCPIVAHVIHTLENTSGNLLARLSGSGATCFGIYDSVKSAADAADKVTAKYPDFWIRRGLLNAKAS